MTVWKFIHKEVSAGSRVILLYVLESTGSSPGRQGFKMAVAGSGETYGSIGGGIMEHKFVEAAKAKLKEPVAATSVHKQLHSKEPGRDQSGMICSGGQTIFLHEVTGQDFIELTQLIQCIDTFANGSIQLSNEGIKFSKEQLEVAYSFKQTGSHFLLIEKAGYKNELHIIGGGHCALALSKVMHELDFYIHVYDERSNLSTLNQNSYANKITVVPYTELSKLVMGGENVYIVIMTAGYRTDDIVLRSLLHKKVNYIGVLGSKKKIEIMLEQYAKEEIAIHELSVLKAPIGISINSETPAEIAISIAAEIISVKNRR